MGRIEEVGPGTSMYMMIEISCLHIQYIYTYEAQTRGWALGSHVHGRHES